MTIQTFKRHERKYLLSTQTYQLLLKRLEPFMTYDDYCAKNGFYTVYNVYYDTIDDYFIRYSIAKPYYKEKVRIRSYVVPTDDKQHIFLEVKKKIGKTGNKRRVVLPLKDAINFIERGIIPKTDNPLDTQIIKEMTVLFSDYPIFPKTAISYNRVALFGKNDNEIRMTFDTNIFTTRDTVDLKNGHIGENLLPNNTILFELKIGDSMPLWLSEILSELHIFPAKFSKYANEYKRYLERTTHYAR